MLPSASSWCTGSGNTGIPPAAIPLLYRAANLFGRLPVQRAAAGELRWRDRCPARPHRDRRRIVRQTMLSLPVLKKFAAQQGTLARSV